MSSFGFTNGAYNRASGTRDAFGQLSDALVKEGYPAMVSRSGDRELEDQIKLFTDRYTQQSSGSGKYGDVKIWNGAKYGFPGGTRWVRTSPKGTVAVPTDPPTSNHGKRRSNDLMYPYNDKSTKAHKRAQQLAPKYNITCEGLGFSDPEEWHWTHWGALGTISSSGGNTASNGGSTSTKPSTTEEKIMAEIFKAVGNDPRLFIDDFGADDIGLYKPSDSISNTDLINATSAVFGEHKEVTKAQFDIAKAVAQKRWAAKRAEIVKDVVAALLPEIQKILGK